MSIATVTTRTAAQRIRPPRQTDDFYVEPPAAVHALLNHETFWGTIWDPCCGSGTIPHVVASRGLVSIGSDLVDRGAGFPVLDFMAGEPWESPADHIICNPPYGSAQAFIERARGVARYKVAALCRLAFLEGARRRAWFETSGLARVWVFSDRISMPPGDKLAAGEIEAKGGAVAFAWFVWERGHRGPPDLGWLSARRAATS
jgi:hypothetical protein